MGGVVALRTHIEEGVDKMRARACKGELGVKKAQKLRAYLMHGPIWHFLYICYIVSNCRYSRVKWGLE